MGPTVAEARQFRVREWIWAKIPSAMAIDKDTINRETDALFWAGTNYKPGQKLDPKNPADIPYIKIWNTIHAKVQGEADAGTLVTTYDHPVVAQHLADAEVASKAAAAHLDAAIAAPDAATAQTHAATAATATEISNQKAADAAAQQPPVVSPQEVQAAGQEASKTPPPPNAPAADHVAHAQSRAHAHGRRHPPTALAPTPPAPAPTPAPTPTPGSPRATADALPPRPYLPHQPSAYVPHQPHPYLQPPQPPQPYGMPPQGFPGFPGFPQPPMPMPPMPSGPSQGGTPPRFPTPQPPQHHRGHKRGEHRRGEGPQARAVYPGQPSMGPMAPGSGMPGAPDAGSPAPDSGTPPSGDVSPPPPSGDVSPPSSGGSGIGKYLAIGIAVLGGGGLIYYASTQKPSRGPARRSSAVAFPALSPARGVR